jgi:hypothetical protein
MVYPGVVREDDGLEQAFIHALGGVHQDFPANQRMPPDCQLVWDVIGRIPIECTGSVDEQPRIRCEGKDYRESDRQLDGK